MLRNTLLILSLALGPSALAGPGGFEGVGDRGPAPHFGGPPGGGPGSGPRGDMPPPPPHVVAEVMSREAEILAGIAESDPDQHARLLQLKERDHQRYVMHLVRVARNVDRGRRDPAAAERMRAIEASTRELNELARGFDALSTQEQKARRAEMETKAAELFELKQEERRARVEEMRARIDGLSSEIDQREKDRDDIVEEYVDQLVTQPVDL